MLHEHLLFWDSYVFLNATSSSPVYWWNVTTKVCWLSVKQTGILLEFDWFFALNIKYTKYSRISVSLWIFLQIYFFFLSFITYGHIQPQDKCSFLNWCRNIWSCASQGQVLSVYIDFICGHSTFKICFKVNISISKELFK